MNTQHEFYLDNENNADNEIVYENDRFRIMAHGSLHAGNEYYFSGEDLDFAMISNKEDVEYLCCECTLEEIIQHLNKN